MVKSAPLQNQPASAPAKRRRAGNKTKAAALLIAGLMVATAAVAFLMPTRLSLAQEQVIGLLHSGVTVREERSFVDSCVQVGEDGPQAVTRTPRTMIFGDGTSLVTTFSARPTPSNVPCGG